MTSYGHSIRQLLLVDNMSVCLAFDRCRARSFPLLLQISDQAICGYMLSEAHTTQRAMAP